MTNKEAKANLLLILTAAIWGFAFVAQRVGSEYLGAFTFNGIRFTLGSISLIPLILILKCDLKGDIRYIIKAGVIAGIFLFSGANLQQYGMAYTTAGKGGFITSLYIVLIPVISIFLFEKTDIYTWLGALLALAGLYLLCVNESFTIEKGDLVILISSFFWAGHVLLIDRFIKRVDSLVLSSIQFLVCGILSIITAVIIKEPISLNAFKGAFLPICYGGFLSVGVAYTLQVVAQKNAKPSHAAIILSLESVFGAIGGMLFLNETMSIKGVVGCVMIFFGILISQKLIFKKRGCKKTLEHKK